MSIRLGDPPVIEEPARAALVTVVRELVAGCRFDKLEELSEHVAGDPGKRRLSELTRGSGKFPEQHEIEALVRAVAPHREHQIVLLLHAAGAERSAAAARPVPRAGDYAVTGVVGQFRDWDTLGVHRPITLLSTGADLTARVAAGGLPAYVLRETDLDPDPATGLRATLAAAAAGTGPASRLVVICGESSAGKTRAAVEAMHAHLAGWQLLIPHSAASLARLLDQQPILRHTVVWLDEVDRTVGDPVGVEQLRRLLATPDGPLVLLGTLRTDREDALRGTGGWDLLDRRAHRIPLKRRPPLAELDRARELAASDPWLADALERLDDRYGIAEWLAAGPQLLRELDRARTRIHGVERVGAAIVDAAIDCYRAGYTKPCLEPLLTEAHQHYLDQPGDPTSAETFTAALAWARQPIAGATGLLEHHTNHRAVVGDRAFDYLLSNAEQSASPPPRGAIWTILLRHSTPGTLASIGASAYRHGHSRITEILLDRASHLNAVEMLRLIDEVEVITANPTRETKFSALLVQLLAKRRDVAALRARADLGDRRAAEALVNLLAEQGDTQALTERAGSGDQDAAMRLAGLYSERGDVEALTERTARGDQYSAIRLSALLGEPANVTSLRALAERGDLYAASRLAALYSEREDLEELTHMADSDGGNTHANYPLAMLLVKRGDVETLTERADHPDRDWIAAEQLAHLLVKRGDVETLTARADRGDGIASQVLLRLLVERDDLETITARADRGDQTVARWLAHQLVKRGDIETLTTRADRGDGIAAQRLADLLVEGGNVATLKARADRGDQIAARSLAELLAARGQRPAAGSGACP